MSGQQEGSQDYLYRHGIPQLFEDLVAELSSCMPEDPIEFLVSRLQDERKKRRSEGGVVFVLGGPGSGKGTVCELLVKNLGFVHFSAGELLRKEEKREGSKDGQLIAEIMKAGTIVPMEITIRLLKNAMDEYPVGTMFLIDGFPRAMDQAISFEQSVQPCKFLIFIECPEDVMEQRLAKRAVSSGRADDNKYTIQKRFKTFMETTMPVVEYFEKDLRVRKVSSVPPPQEVYEACARLFN